MSKEQTSAPLILTLRMDENSQAFFNALRKKHFPPERNYLDAHLTLFHNLTNNELTLNTLSTINCQTFLLHITGLKFLGAGVAYAVHSEELKNIRNQIATKLQDQLIAQDRQGYRPHITVQNKVTPVNAKQLLEELKTDFKPIIIRALGLDLWQYLNGPWEHHCYHPFEDL